MTTSPTRVNGRVRRALLTAAAGAGILTPIAVAAGSHAGASLPPDDPCLVTSGVLHCAHDPGVPVHPFPSRANDGVDTLRDGSAHGFVCYSFGDPHETGQTWYFTRGDLHGQLGFVPASALRTPQELDDDPSAYGLASCPFSSESLSAAVDSTPITLDPMEGGCDVSDGVLWCGNEGEAPAYDYPEHSDHYADWLEPTVHHGFVCYVDGAEHANGTTWYVTQGDLFLDYGFVPASAIATSQEFDVDPGAHGLPNCDF